MVEALWAQSAGVSYSATEDRKLIWALMTPGISRGLSIAAGTGRQVTVSNGAAVIDDGQGGCYVAYTTDVAVLTLPASVTTNVYVVVNPSTAQTTIEFGATPLNPYLTIGSAQTNATAVIASSIVRSSVKATPPAIGTNYVRLSGGVMTGSLQAPRFVVPGLFGVGQGDVVPNAPQGVRLGGAYATARHYLFATAKPPSGSTNVVPNAPDNAHWAGIHWNLPAVHNVTDYAHAPIGPGDWPIYPGVPGYYLFSGYITFKGRSGGFRQVRVSVWNKNGANPDTYSYAQYSTEHPMVNANDFTLNYTSLISIGKPENQFARVDAYQNSGASLPITNGRLIMRLIQAN